MEQGTTHVGLDVSKRTIAIAVRWPGRKEPEERSMPNEPRAVARWAKRMEREARGPIVCAYEAGPTGYALPRLNLPRFRGHLSYAEISGLS